MGTEPLDWNRVWGKGGGGRGRIKGNPGSYPIKGGVTLAECFAYVRGTLKAKIGQTPRTGGGIPGGGGGVGRSGLLTSGKKMGVR